MAIVIKPPLEISPVVSERNLKSMFLAGSIEMGVAEDWQTKVQNILKDTDIIVYNPRRDDWDSSWTQEISNPKFFEQVTWELDHIDKSDYVVVYFDPTTKSPITLLELGILAKTPEKVLVCCPEGFWRKGNVDIVCKRYGISQVETPELFYDAIKALSKEIQQEKILEQ